MSTLLQPALGSQNPSFTHIQGEQQIQSQIEKPSAPREEESLITIRKNVV